MSETNPNLAAPTPGPVPPQWMYIMGILLGMPVIGGGSAYFGNTQASSEAAQAATESRAKQAADVAALEQKVDALDDKIDALLLGFVRAHPDVTLDRP